MNFAHAWKIISSLSWSETVLVFALSAAAFVGACIALWNAVPIGVEYSMGAWRRQMRRSARRRWYTRRHRPDEAQAIEPMHRDAHRTSQAGRHRLPSKAWLAVAACSAASVLAGLGLGYVLNRPTDHSFVNTRLTEAVRDPARLRIDYELRNP